MTQYAFMLGDSIYYTICPKKMRFSLFKELIDFKFDQSYVQSTNIYSKKINNITLIMKYIFVVHKIRWCLPLY